MIEYNEKKNKIFGKEQEDLDWYVIECFRILYNRDPEISEIIKYERNENLKTELIFRANQKILFETIR